MKFEFAQKYHNVLYFIFRVVIGLLFAGHGAQKLFGWFGGSVQPLVSLMGLAGIIEFVAGLLIVLGLFTRLGALLSAVTMVAAFFIAHVGSGLNPLTNGGELAVVYFVSFLVVLVHGARKWGLEEAWLGKEFF